MVLRGKDRPSRVLPPVLPGNSEGQKKIERTAQTRANEILASKGFDAKKDRVIFQGVKSRDDFVSALKAGNEAAKTSGPVRELDLVSHSGADGPVFHEDSAVGPMNPHGGVQLSSQEIKDLPKLNWASGAGATFCGCRTSQFASQFAQAEHVRSFGTPSYANFSSNPDHFSPDNGGGLYLKTYLFGGAALGVLNPAESMKEYDPK